MDLATPPLWIAPVRTAHDQWATPRGCRLVDLTVIEDAYMKARMLSALATEAGVTSGEMGEA